MFENTRVITTAIAIALSLSACGPADDASKAQPETDSKVEAAPESTGGATPEESAPTTMATPEPATANGFVADANLPTDAEATCTADVASWFGGGVVTANGWVNPANSEAAIFADSANNTRCDFYKWGAQMFLWLTSGTGSGHVFNTAPVFYNVSVAEDNERYFLAGDGPMALGVRKSKTDAEIELGQAGGGDVLLSQAESLVYYGLHANDVFALYTTGAKNGASGLPDGFPSTPDEVTEVANYAAGYGYPLQDTQAMAMELKVSWVDAATLSDTSTYVLSQAEVPVFDRAAIDPQTGKQQWSITGTEVKTVALVGMHVVGTVNGHPEMVWSTFEHVDNVPDATYTYTTSSGGTGTQSYDSSGHWTFLPSGAPAPTAITANGKISTYSGDGAECEPADPNNTSECIVNTISGTPIGPIDVFRVDPWGNDQSNSGVIDNNTDLVSINVSVLSQLAAGDLRGNYIQSGGIWTVDGQIPPGYPDTLPDYLRGSLNLANTTMETFYQLYNSAQGAFNPINCFGCHGSTTAETEISHIYDQLQPLPQK